MEMQDNMTRIVIINNCTECPYIKKSGGFGDVAYRPLCDRMKRKELPHTKNVDQLTNMVTAIASPGIPKWCPLDFVTMEEHSPPEGIDNNATKH